MFIFDFDHLDWLSLFDFHNEWKKLENQSIFKFSPEVQVGDLGQNLIMTKTS